jgi:hypothetical protein
VCKQSAAELLKITEPAMTKGGLTTRDLSNNISTIVKMELMEVQRDNSLHNNKTRASGIDESKEMLKANTATENNIEENGTTAIKCAKQLPGKEPQQTTLNDTERTHCDNSTHTVTIANQSNYTPHKKTGNHF